MSLLDRYNNNLKKLEPQLIIHLANFNFLGHNQNLHHQKVARIQIAFSLKIETAFLI